MHRCEFCAVTFQNRPQVKRPRACPACQRKRQRANEKAWHSKHKEQFDSQYAKIQKIQRMKRIKEKAIQFKEWIEVGRRFSKQFGALEGLGEFLFQFLVRLGVRRVNKLCGRA